jgi:cation transport regulator ChaC
MRIVGCGLFSSLQCARVVTLVKNKKVHVVMLCYHIIEPSNVLCAQERIWGIAYKIPEHEVNDVMGQLDRRERCGYHTVQQMFYPEDKTWSSFP